MGLKETEKLQIDVRACDGDMEESDTLGTNWEDFWCLHIFVSEPVCLHVDRPINTEDKAENSATVIKYGSMNVMSETLSINA